MDGRVKTLHPRVHAGILARRQRPDDLAALAAHDITPIDLVVVNLYPFARAAEREETTVDDLIEEIDIGGPSMVRAAAKNFRDVLVVVDPGDYSRLLTAIDEGPTPTFSPALVHPGSADSMAPERSDEWYSEPPAAISCVCRMARLSSEADSASDARPAFALSPFNAPSAETSPRADPCQTAQTNDAVISAAMNSRSRLFDVAGTSESPTIVMKSSRIDRAREDYVRQPSLKREDRGLPAFPVSLRDRSGRSGSESRPLSTRLPELPPLVAGDANRKAERARRKYGNSVRTTLCPE